MQDRLLLNNLALLRLRRGCQVQPAQQPGNSPFARFSAAPSKHSKPRFKRRNC